MRKAHVLDRVPVILTLSCCLERDVHTVLIVDALRADIRRATTKCAALRRLCRRPGSWRSDRSSSQRLAGRKTEPIASRPAAIVRKWSACGAFLPDGLSTSFSSPRCLARGS